MKWFKENEFACKCCGELPPLARANVRALVDNVLDPVRNLYGGAIRVTSGYRCERHNKEVGGAERSQHLCGEAADIVLAGLPLTAYGLQELARLIVMNGRWDQLILEDVPRNGLAPKWVHVSFRKDGRNRKQILKKYAGSRVYTPVSEAEILSRKSVQRETRKEVLSSVKSEELRVKSYGSD